MSALFSALASVQWGTVLGVISLVVFLASTAVGVFNRLRKLPPDVRNQYLHQALAAAITLADNESNLVLPELVKNVNLYLKLHGVPISVSEQELKLVMAEVKHLAGVDPRMVQSK